MSMTHDDINYALVKQIPDMQRGFTIQTAYGDLEIDATDAAKFIDLANKVFNTKLRKTHRESQQSAA